MILVNLSALNKPNLQLAVYKFDIICKDIQRESIS